MKNPRLFDFVDTLKNGDFPVALSTEITLRDLFAAAALGTKIVGALIGYEDHAPEHRSELVRRLSRDCFEIADAMLAEREKREEGK